MHNESILTKRERGARMNKLSMALRLRNALFIIIALLGFVVAYWFWSNDKHVPVLDKTDPFVLEGINGEKYNSDNSKIKLVTFFYTNCPDICPLTMVDFKEIQAQLKTEGLFGTRVELLAITLDPEHDNIALIISEYAKTFAADPDGWKFLRGTPQQTNVIADSYHMKYTKINSNIIAHNTTMFLIDDNNRIRALFDMAKPNKPVNKEEVMKTIKMVIQEQKV
jgi:protein SCO1/2